MRKNKLFSLLILITLFIPTACWDTRDLNDRIFITSIGIDKVVDDDIVPLEVTIEVLNPALLRSRIMGNYDGKVSVVYSHQGETIGMALEQLQARLPHPITLAHLRTIIVGEEMAKEHFVDTANFFEKNPQVARRLRLMFVDGGTAKELLHTELHFESNIAHKLAMMTQWERDMPFVRINTFTDFIRNLRTAEGKGFGTRIMTGPDGTNLVLSGGAILHDWKLVDFLDDEETRKANWLFDRVNRSKVTGQLDQGRYTYQVDGKSLKIEPHVANGSISFTVNIKTSGRVIHEQGNTVDLNRAENISPLEKMFSQTIKKEAEEIIEKAQKELKVDFFAFDMALMDKEPDLLQSLDWDATFPEVPIKVEVEAKINRLIIAR